MGMRRCLFSGLVGCVVGRFLAADVQGKHGPCSPDLQRSDAPVLHAGLRAAGPRVEMALFGVLLGLLSRQAVSAIVTMAGGTLSPDPVELGGPHQGPAPAGGVAARRRGGV